MVRCPVCKRVTRYDGVKCTECGHKYTKDEIVKLSESENEYKGKVTLRERLRDRAFWCDMLGTFFMIMALALIAPAITNLLAYFRAEKRVGAAHLSDYAKSIYVKGIVLSVLVVVAIIASIVLFYVKRRTIRKRKQISSI